MIVVHENKVPLGLGWVAVIFGVAVGIIYALTGGDGFVGILLIEVPTFLAGILLFMDYFLRRLTIEDSACCYRTMFGRCRFFAVQDIKSVRLYTRGFDVFISLIGEQEQLLARLESNMIGIEELLTYLEKRKIPIVESEKPPFDNLDYYEDTAKDGEQFYQTPAWKKVIRILRNLLAVTGILLFLVTWLILPPPLSAWLYIGYPLVLYVFYLVFHGAITVGRPTAPSKEWKKSHITLPCLGLVLLLIRALADARLFYFCGFDPLVWAPVVAVILMIPYFLIVRPKSKALCCCVVGIIAAYSMTVPAYINVALTKGSPEHEIAVVMEKESYRSGKWTHKYKVYLYPQKETFEIDSGLYESVEEGDVVRVCKRTSVFGLEYWRIHQ